MTAKKASWRDHAHPLYETWVSMRQRCTNPNHKRFAAYGARGITIDPVWDSFDQFVADMGPRPEGTSLDRKDNAGPYSKGNCRWATHEEQNNNRTGYNVALTHNGLTMSIAEWARAIGIGYTTLHMRLRRGWSTEKALSCPAK